MACVNLGKESAVINCDLYTPLPELPPVVEDYWFEMESSINEKDKLGEELFADEILFKNLLSTIAKQRLKFKEKGCPVQ